MRLILMRHGEAISGDSLRDHDRPLTPRGRDEARSVGAQLLAHAWAPALVRSSDAVRTRQTWEAISGSFAPRTVSWTRDLYNPSLERLVADAASWSAADRTVLCLGHNPGWSDAATRLSGARVGMGTAFAALLEGEGADWTEAFTHPWTLEHLLRP